MMHGLMLATRNPDHLLAIAFLTNKAINLAVRCFFRHLDPSVRKLQHILLSDLSAARCFPPGRTIRISDHFFQQLRFKREYKTATCMVTGSPTGYGWLQFIMNTIVRERQNYILILSFDCRLSVFFR
jgi:hypothetical protein